jgi:hypothetical protein
MLRSIVEATKAFIIRESGKGDEPSGGWSIANVSCSSSGSFAMRILFVYSHRCTSRRGETSAFIYRAAGYFCTLLPFSGPTCRLRRLS